MPLICCGSFSQGLKYTVTLLGSIVLIIVLPIVAVTMWKPYEMYCLSRLDTFNEVPSWCFDKFPSVYGYVQDVYWDVGFLKFVDRYWYLFVTALFTN